MKTGLVVIDVQNLWAECNPLTTTSIEHAVDALRAKMPVMWVYMNLIPVGAPFRASGLSAHDEFNHCSAGPNLLPAIQPHPDDWILTKSDFSMFDNPHTGPFLREQGFGHLLMAGFKTNQCVFRSARDSKYTHGFNTTVLAGLTADDFDEKYDDTAERLARYDIGLRSLARLGL